MFVRTCVILLAVFLTAQAHVQLLYPPATLNLDFLDTFRTSGICGHEASGAEQTEEWRLPEVNERTVTEFEAGANVTVFWALHYAHQGGWLFELYNADGDLTSTWNSSDHWDCVSDSTQQRATITMPETPCEGCILRLRRQALEWGANYRFHSCALVDIVEDADPCFGCSGHGRCVRGRCQCDSSEEDGFWYGDYCESQNECEEDEHCGEGGVCVDTGNITPPNKQCYCREGYFGSVAQPLRGSFISPRICDTESNLELGDPENWADEYPFELASVPEGNFKLYYQIFPGRGLIEFAIRARTSNWAAFGFRPIATGETEGGRGRNNRRGSGDDEETEAEGEGDNEDTEADGEGAASEEDNEDDDSSKRRLLKMIDMPQIDLEAEEKTVYRRSLLQNGDEEDTEAEGEGEGDGDEDEDTGGNRRNRNQNNDEDEETEAEGEGDDEETKAEGEGDEETEAEGEGDEDTEAEGEGEGDGDEDGLCEDGRPTTTEYDAGLHDLASPRRGNRNLKSVEMPTLQSEKMESLRVKSAVRSLMQDEETEAEGEGDDEETEAEGEGDEDEETEAEGEGDEETEAEGEGDGDEAESEGEGVNTDSDDVIAYVPELIGEGTECENIATTSAAHPMINQDIYVVYAKDGLFRIQDSFTPSRSKPLPDVYYDGDDGIIDAVGSEIDGFTNVKFRRRLTSADINGDYCILEEVDYLMVYAYGQETRNFTHIPNSGLETGRASNRRFYGEDELKFHGGGIGTTFEGRGVLGAVNFFDEPAPTREDGDGCIESTMDDFDCMQEALGGDYILHWTVEDDGVRFACETTATGWVALGWPETPGVMLGTEAVLGLGGDENSVSVYSLEAKAPTGIVQNEDLFEIEDGEIEQGDDFTILRFKRIFDNDFDGEGEIDLLVAFNPTANAIEYHGPTSRGGITVTLS